jgi:hypothetical protein
MGQNVYKVLTIIDKIKMSLNIGPHTRLHPSTDLSTVRLLTLYFAGNINTFTENIGKLGSLHRLVINGDEQVQDNLTSLPESLCNLRFLRILDIWECPALETLPQRFGDLRSLQELTFDRCTALQTLPETISNLTCLSVLKIEYCESIKMLPGTIRHLTSLKELSIKCRSALETIPETIATITSLQKLTLDYGRCSVERTFILDLSVIHTAIAVALTGLNLTELVICAVDCDIIRLMHGMDKLQKIHLWHSGEDITREHLLLIGRLYKQDIKKLNSLSFGRMALNTISEEMNLPDAVKYAENTHILNHFRSEQRTEQRITRAKLAVCALARKMDISLFSCLDDLAFQMICEMVTENATIKGIARCEKCQKQIRDYLF